MAGLNYQQVYEQVQDQNLRNETISNRNQSGAYARANLIKPDKSMVELNDMSEDEIKEEMSSEIELEDLLSLQELMDTDRNRFENYM